MDRQRAARGAVVAGLATIALGLWFSAQEAVRCDGILVSSVSAMGAFQMAKSQSALDTAIGCADRLVVLNAMNRVDLVAFIASYGLLMVLGILALADGRLRRIALVFTGVALAGDVVETGTQLWIGAHWPATTTPMLMLLALGSSLKWAGIAGGLGALGLSAARERGGATRWLGVSIGVFGLLGLLVFLAPSPPPFTSVAFLLLVAACTLNARRGPAPGIRPTASR